MSTKPETGLQFFLQPEDVIAYLPLPATADLPFHSVVINIFIHLFGNKYLLTTLLRQCHTLFFVLLWLALLSLQQWHCKLEQLPLKLLSPVARPSDCIPFPYGFSRTVHAANVFSLCLSVNINHKLEYLFCQSTCPGFLFGNMVTGWRACGCDSLSLPACSC